MNTALWIAQIVMAALFTMAGLAKTLQPIEKLKVRMPWVERVPAAQVRFIGVSQLLGAIGLILPWALGIVPILTPIAAVGLGTIQVLAAVHHIRHNEVRSTPINFVFILMSAFIAFGRF